MSGLQVVDRSVDPFDTVKLDPDGRIDYDGDRLVALYPEGSDATEFRVALFHYDSERATVDLPEGSAVLSASEGVVTTLVPVDAYEGGDGE